MNSFLPNKMFVKGAAMLPSKQNLLGATASKLLAKLRLYPEYDSCCPGFNCFWAKLFQDESSILLLPNLPIFLPVETSFFFAFLLSFIFL